LSEQIQGQAENEDTKHAELNGSSKGKMERIAKEEMEKGDHRKHRRVHFKKPHFEKSPSPRMTKGEVSAKANNKGDDDSEDGGMTKV
jgi:hypothetical protein